MSFIRCRPSVPLSPHERTWNRSSASWNVVPSLHEESRASLARSRTPSTTGRRSFGRSRFHTWQGCAVQPPSRPEFCRTDPEAVYIHRTSRNGLTSKAGRKGDPKRFLESRVAGILKRSFGSPQGASAVLLSSFLVSSTGRTISGLLSLKGLRSGLGVFPQRAHLH
jgi:hypothetical protein